MKRKKITRRQFVGSVSASAAVPLLPTAVRCGLSVEKLRTAHIGVGGMGRSDLGAIASHPKIEVAALCDVDRDQLAQAKKNHVRAETFTDYRSLFADMAEKIDAVVVSTPDHSHAPPAMTAMNLGKPVYCQKPLTHNIFEARQLRLVSKRKKLATQMGIQVHSSAAYRCAVQWIQSGVIGRIRHVHAWSNKNWGYDGGPFTDQHEVPSNLDWNSWIGTAEMRPYVPKVYHPGNWRRLIDFGTGTLGDMGVHICDTPFAALELTAPLWAETTCRKPNGIGHPTKNVVDYEFPGTKFTANVLRWTWYDGASSPRKPTDLKEIDATHLPTDYPLPGQGSLMVGETGSMVLPHVAQAQLFPAAKFKDVKRPDVGNENHYHQWLEACITGTATSAGFGYAGPLTEALLLGVVANRFPSRKLMWDAENMKVTNMAAPNDLLRRSYRDGFEVENL